ncbi:MAG: corrinoid protein [Calditrichia bacterium]
MQGILVEEIFKKLAYVIERGKVDAESVYPPDMRGQEGAIELTRLALEEGISATEILTKGLMVGMRAIGDKFGRGEAFIPDLMIAAKAMNAATVILRPHFESGEEAQKGIFIIGTVSGDLHDIGKNIVKMILEGAGFKVVDLGTDVSTQKFLEAVEAHPRAAVGMSALLTTTMQNMEKSVQEIKKRFPKQIIVIGGAPVTEEFCRKIGADAYFPSPHSLPDYLENVMPR